MSQVNGKLSSRVMNMKFMKFSQQENAGGDVESLDNGVKKSTIPDNSQWDLKQIPKDKVKKNNKLISVRRKQKNVRSNVSITDLKRETNEVIRGRRVIAEASDDKESKRKRDESEDEYDLDKIFKQVKKGQ